MLLISGQLVPTFKGSPSEAWDSSDPRFPFTSGLLVANYLFPSYCGGQDVSLHSLKTVIPQRVREREIFIQYVYIEHIQAAEHQREDKNQAKFHTQELMFWYM